MSKEDDVEYEVEKIMAEEFLEEQNTFRYFVKWKNYSIKHNSWVFASDLHCPELLEKFHKKHTKNGKFRSGRLSSPPLRHDSSAKRQRFHSDASDEECQFKDPEEEFMEDLNAFLKKYKGEWRFKRIRPGTMELNYAGHLFGSFVDMAVRTPSDVNVSLQHFATYMQNKCNEQNVAAILVENNVDLEVPPRSFRYITECIWSPTISVNKDIVVGCNCVPYCSSKSKCACPIEMDAQFAYRFGDKISISAGNPIFECNKRCLCERDCPNRTVQRGRQVKLCIFRTLNGRGWGVKTLQAIKKDSFVMEYVGEVIGTHEADVRYEENGAEYLFDLDFYEKEPEFVIDATYVGNESHFVNHSCEPNMTVYNVFIDHLDLRLPRIALFANRDIDKNEELTFDYAMCSVGVIPERSSDDDDDEDDSSSASASRISNSDSYVISKVVSKYAKKKAALTHKRLNGHVKCRCGSKQCRGFVFLDKKVDDAVAPKNVSLDV